MKYFTLQPSAQLADYVRYFWVFEGEASEAQPYLHRTMANGCPELLFHYKGAFRELLFDQTIQSSFLTGIHAQTNQYRRFIVHEPFGMFGAYLYPYALTSLFNIPAIELTNQLPDLASLVKSDELEEKMLMAIDHTERLSIIENYLVQKIKQPKQPAIMLAVKEIIKHRGQLNIRQLSETYSLSTRQFERNFKEHTGFSAKTFSTIIRFNAVLAQKHQPEQSMLDIAYNFGYYDQSHFVQDFKTFSGYSPRMYFSGLAGDVL